MSRSVDKMRRDMSERWSGENKDRSAGARTKIHPERGAERCVGALERDENNGRSAEREPKIGRSAGALIPLDGPL